MPGRFLSGISIKRGDGSEIRGTGPGGAIPRRRSRLAAFLKWPIYAALVVSVLSGAASIWIGLVWCAIQTKAVLGW